MKLFKRAVILATALLGATAFGADSQDDITAKIESKLGFDVIAVADAEPIVARVEDPRREATRTT